LALGLAVVVASMLLLFTVPASYFAAATFFSTSCMIGAAIALGALRTRRPGVSKVMLGIVAAAMLYFIFYFGAWTIDSFHPFGMTSASESSIYSLIASPSNPLPVQAALLVFDSAGYESFFRGVLQNRLQPRFGARAAFAVALLDAGLHTATLNPVWVGATLVTDLIWGLTYYYGRGVQASFTSHLVWDIAIFLIAPVR
jgi:membrane protease YdiL (CAAX protease family)